MAVLACPEASGIRPRGRCHHRSSCCLAPPPPTGTVPVLSPRSAARPRRGAEGTSFPVSGSTPFQHAADLAGGPTDCPADLPLARMEIFVCVRKPFGSDARAFAGLDCRLGSAEHVGQCRAECNARGQCGGGRRRAAVERDRIALDRFPVGRDVANVPRRSEFGGSRRSRLSVELRSRCNLGGGRCGLTHGRIDGHRLRFRRAVRTACWRQWGCRCRPIRRRAVSG